MLTDRELLEMAAKAAGLRLNGEFSWRGVGLMQGPHNYWNPLEDDGEVLRLAVKLDIHIGPNPGNGAALAYSSAHLAEEPHGVDKQAATRRAIVRVAAEIAAQHPRTDGGGHGS